MSEPIAVTRYENHLSIYVQVAHILREKLGIDWSVGAQLPSEQALAEEFGVNRHTIRRAVSLLAAEGLISRTRGRRIVVLRGPVYEVPKLSGDVTDFFRINPGSVFKPIRFRRQPLPQNVANLLELPDGAVGYRIDRLLLSRGETLAFLMAFVPEDVGESLNRHSIENETLVSILTNRLNQPVTSADQAIEAALADPQVSRKLGVAPGSPILRMRFLFRDQNARPVNLVNYNYRGDRYMYTAQLSARVPPGTSTSKKARVGHLWAVGDWAAQKVR